LAALGLVTPRPARFFFALAAAGADSLLLLAGAAAAGGATSLRGALRGGGAAGGACSAAFSAAFFATCCVASGAEGQIKASKITAPTASPAMAQGRARSQCEACAICGWLNSSARCSGNTAAVRTVESAL
jgi:hypothetical protein